jgi:hypothetical protein
LELFEFEAQLFDVFYRIGVRDDAVDGTDGDTGWFVVVSYTLGASVRIDDIDRIVLFDRPVGTLFAACIASDTFICNDKGHSYLTSFKFTLL